MNLADGLLIAQNTKWSFVNSFEVELDIKDALKTKCKWSEVNPERLQLAIISIDTPQLSNNPIEVFTGNQWRYNNGRDELYRFTITFRDYDMMNLYGKFISMYKETKEQYFDDATIDVKIYKMGDYHKETRRLVMDLSKCIIENVSQVQFNNTTENQIVEFSVGFKTGFIN